MSEEESIVNTNKEIRGKIEVQEENNPRRERGVVRKSGVDVLRFGMAQSLGFYTPLTLSFMKRGGELRVGMSKDSAPGISMPPLA